MTRNVGVAELKTHLSEHLRAVRRGHTVTVLDRATPIARIVPVAGVHAPLAIRKGTGALRDIEAPPKLTIKSDILELLREERQGQR